MMQGCDAWPSMLSRYLHQLRDTLWGLQRVLCGQAAAVEHSLVAALPLGPQSAAGGVSLPDTFHGELQVTSLGDVLDIK